MVICKGNRPAKSIRLGTTPVRALRLGKTTVWQEVRTESGEDFGEWTYDDPVRRRTVTPWERDLYADGSVGERRFGTPHVEEQTAATAVDWDGETYWNGSCGADYYYVDYQKVRSRHVYPDGVVRYSDYRNGESRSRRVDGQCGWVRDWRVVRDWYRTGGTCNAIGVNGAHDCDGTYSVTYWNEGQDQSYCYPDMSGSTGTRTLWRVGPVATRIQVDGQCGYTPRKHELTVEDGWNWAGESYDSDHDCEYRGDDGTLYIETERFYSYNQVVGTNLWLRNILLDGQAVDASALSVRKGAENSRNATFSYSSGYDLSLDFDEVTNGPWYYEGTIIIEHSATGARIEVQVSLNVVDY